MIEEMQRQHQREVERLTQEREKVLQEETNATIAGASYDFPPLDKSKTKNTQRAPAAIVISYQNLFCPV